MVRVCEQKANGGQLTINCIFIAKLYNSITIHRQFLAFVCLRSLCSLRLLFSAFVIFSGKNRFIISLLDTAVQCRQYLISHISAYTPLVLYYSTPVSNFEVIY